MGLNTQAAKTQREHPTTHARPPHANTHTGGRLETVLVYIPSVPAASEPHVLCVPARAAGANNYE